MTGHDRVGFACREELFAEHISDHKQGDETDRKPESLLSQLFVCNPFEVNF